MTDSRDTIVHAAWNIVSEQGLSGVTMRSVANRAEVSLGRVQYYFATKDELVLQSCASLARVMWGSGIAGDESLNDCTVEQLKSELAKVVPHDAQSRQFAIAWNAFVVQSMVWEELAVTIVAVKRAQERVVARMLLALSNQGVGGETTAELEEGEAHAIARTLMAIADGLAQRVLIADVQRNDAIELLEWEIDSVFMD